MLFARCGHRRSQTPFFLSLFRPLASARARLPLPHCRPDAVDACARAFASLILRAVRSLARAFGGGGGGDGGGGDGGGGDGSDARARPPLAFARSLAAALASTRKRTRRRSACNVAQGFFAALSRVNRARARIDDDAGHRALPPFARLPASHSLVRARVRLCIANPRAHRRGVFFSTSKTMRWRRWRRSARGARRKSTSPAANRRRCSAAFARLPHLFFLQRVASSRRHRATTSCAAKNGNASMLRRRRSSSLTFEGGGDWRVIAIFARAPHYIRSVCFLLLFCASLFTSSSLFCCRKFRATTRSDARADS